MFPIVLNNMSTQTLQLAFDKLLAYVFKRRKKLEITKLIHYINESYNFIYSNIIFLFCETKSQQNLRLGIGRIILVYFVSLCIM